MNAQSIINKILRFGNENPERIAIIDNENEITYKELLDLSFAVAQTICKIDLKNDWIPICVNDGWKSYASILGVWMSGKGYLPINTQFPKADNLEKMNQVSANKLFSHSDQKGYPFELIKAIQEPVDRTIKVPQNAYLIFTSGTTGNPKGVPIEFEQLSAFVEHYDQHPNIRFTQSDRFLQSYELTFDVSVFCYLMAFYSGSTLVIPQQTNIKFQGFFKAIEKHKVSVVSFVPSIVRLSYPFLDRLVLPSVRYSFFSGEALMGNWAKKWMRTVKQAEVYNCYGPTETVIVCTEEHLNELDAAYFENGQPLPLGKLFDGISIRIEAEEIVFRGRQMFQGYLNQNEIQEYYSGDLASYDENQKLLFKGRKDNQVQWNGYRIELQEIEEVLYREKGILVKVVFIEEENKMFVFGLEKDVESKSEYEALFPKHYLPSQFIELRSFPLNANGKYDFNKLKEMCISL